MNATKLIQVDTRSRQETGTRNKTRTSTIERLHVTNAGRRTVFVSYGHRGAWTYKPAGSR